ncbi:hypothetical protein SCA6_000193 [Theobroma cacao]
MAMKVKDIVFMNKGDGENSYVKSAGLTLKVIAKTQPIVQKAVQSLFTGTHSTPLQVVNVADLGCALGPQPLESMSIVIESIVEKCGELGCEMPEIQFHLNDLAGNDFNTLFKGLSVVQEKYKNVSWPAFPSKLHASCAFLLQRTLALQGLPLNKGKIYMSKTSPPAVREGYLSQFEEDFSSVLRFRSPELAPDGRMVLILNGRQSADPTEKDICYLWDLLAEALSYLVSEGLIDEEKLDSFNVPYYNPSQEEVERVIDKEGSFTTEFSDTVLLEIGEIGEKDLEGHRRRYGYQEYQGLIDEGKLDSFNVPYYNPSQNEVQCLVDKEGYLTTESIDTIALDIGRAQTQELKATDALRSPFCHTSSGNS